MKKYKQKINFTIFLIVVFLSTFLSITLSLNPATAGTIRLVGLDEVNLEKNFILLKDVAHVYADNSDLREKLEQIEIGLAPPVGRTRTIDENDIRLYLKKAHMDSGNTEIVLRQPISVMRASMEISSEFIEASVVKYIKNNALSKDLNFAIKEINWSGDVILPSGELTYKIEQRYQKDFIGNVPLIVFFHVNGRFEKRLPVMVRLEVIANIVVARNPIHRGQIIKISDLDLRSLELSKIKGQPAMDINAILGKRAIHQIYPETVISENDVETPPVLKRGDTVKIVVAFSNLLATAQGLVREDGRIGEKIKVVNIDSKKSLYATVIDRHTVRIEF